MLYATKTYKCLSPSLIFSDPADVCNPKTYFAKRIADSWDRKCPIAAGKYPVSISQYLPEIVGAMRKEYLAATINPKTNFVTLA